MHKLLINNFQMHEEQCESTENSGSNSDELKSIKSNIFLRH